MDDKTMLKVVMTDGSIHQCEAFTPRVGHQLKVEFGGDVIEGIWVAANKEGWDLYMAEDKNPKGVVTRYGLEMPRAIPGATIMVTLRNNASCLGEGSWGMVFPAKLMGRDRHPRIDLRLIDFPATMKTNGGSMPFIMAECVEALD